MDNIVGYDETEQVVIPHKGRDALGRHQHARLDGQSPKRREAVPEDQCGYRDPKQ